MRGDATRAHIAQAARVLACAAGTLNRPLRGRHRSTVALTRRYRIRKGSLGTSDRSPDVRHC